MRRDGGAEFRRRIINSSDEYFAVDNHFLGAPTLFYPRKPVLQALLNGSEDMMAPQIAPRPPSAFGRFARLVSRSRIRSDQSGAAAVEFALIALPFFALIGAIIETAMVFLAGQILDTAVNDAARLIRTGQAQQSMNEASFKTALCDKLYILIKCADVYIDVRTSATFAAIGTTKPIDDDGKFVKDFSYTPGKASEIVTVKAYYEYPLVFSGFGLDLSDLANGKRLIGAVAAFRNEPFPW